MNSLTYAFDPELQHIVRFRYFCCLVNFHGAQNKFIDRSNHDTNNITPTLTNVDITFDMAPRSKRQRHLKKVVESQDRTIDGRFRGEVAFLRESCVSEDIILNPRNNSEAIDNEIDSDSEENIRIEDNIWRVLPDCADDLDGDNPSEEIELDHDLNNSNISANLLTSIEDTEKRWRLTGHNCGRRDCGTSRSTFFRKKEQKAAEELEDRHLPKIGSFFRAQPRRPAYDTDEESELCQFILGEVANKHHIRKKYSVEEAMESLRPLVTDSRDRTQLSNSLLAWEITKARAVYKYYSLLIDGLSKMDSSGTVAFFFYPHSTKTKTAMVLSDANKSYKARSIRQWADQYLEMGEFQKYKQGQHVKTFSVFNDEANKKMIHSYLRELTDEERTPLVFMEHCNKPDGLLTKFKDAPKAICYDTAKRWLISLGFNATIASKGWFTDAHERPDVVASRVKFLADMAELETRMTFYRGDDMSIPVPAELKDGEKEAVLVTHDESTFYCNEGRRFFWLENGKKKLLPKSKGTSIMISGFCCHCHGFMSLPDGSKTYQLFKAGISREGWFTNQHLVNQFNACVDVLRHYHPNCELTIAFDNSMTHRARAPDGLEASRLNKVNHSAFIHNLKLC